MIEWNDVTVYHAGDTVVYDGLIETLSAWDIDVALLPINGRDYFRTQRGIIGNTDFRETARLTETLDIGAVFALRPDRRQHRRPRAFRQPPLRLESRCVRKSCSVPPSYSTSSMIQTIRVNRLVRNPRCVRTPAPSSTIDAGYGPSSASACFVSSQRSVVPCFNPSPTTRWTRRVKSSERSRKSRASSSHMGW